MAIHVYSVGSFFLNCEIERALAIGVGSSRDARVSMELGELNNKRPNDRPNGDAVNGQCLPQSNEVNLYI